MISFKKKENKKLSNNFYSDEFSCPCNKCDNDIQYIAQELVDKLQKIRDKYGKSIKVTSGYRCPSHNLEVGGVPASSHMAGIAADISPSLITLDDLDTVYELCYNEFNNIGDGRSKKFIHVDIRPSKQNGKRHWIY
jgi:uncharacterized protein YcbK (DUF882 family)